MDGQYLGQERTQLSPEKQRFEEFKRQANHIKPYFENIKIVIRKIKNFDYEILENTLHISRQSFNQLLVIFYRVYEKYVPEITFVDSKGCIQYFEDINSNYATEIEEVLEIIEKI